MAIINTLGRAARFGSKAVSKEALLSTMSVGSIVGRQAFKTAQSGYRSFTGMPKTMDNTALKVGAGLAAAGVGFASAVGPTTKEAMLDISLGSPDADVAFTGRDLDARFIAGSAMGGALGGLLASTSSDIIGTGAYEQGGGTAANTVMTGGVIGTAIGIGAAAMGSKKFGSKAIFQGRRGAARKMGLGMSAVVGGGAVGAGIPASGMYSSGEAAKRQSGDEWMNESVFSERARNSSASISAVTRATGDIVFGMHNTRGGM
jgi:hypothetical protein